MRDTAYQDRFFELLGRAEDEGYSPDASPLLEEAFKLADEQNDPEYGLLARYFYVFAIAPIEPHRAVVAFSWCVAHEDHASELIPRSSVAQLYGIVGGILRSYPDYSLSQIEATFDEMEQKFRELGLPMRDVWHHRIYGCLGVGDRETAAEYYARWDQMEPVAGACSVCEVGTRVIYNIYLENYDNAFRWARPIWEGLRCDDGQPLMAASASLVPLLRCGEMEMAEQCFRMSVNELQTISYAGIWAAGRQLTYLATVGPVEDAIASFNRYFSVAWTSGTPSDRFGYLIAATLFARRLAEDDRAVELQIPDVCELHDVSGRYQADDLVDFFDATMNELGARFDRRNGNDEYLRIANLTQEIFEEVRQ